MTTKAYGGPWEPGAFSEKVFLGVDFSNRCLVGADFSGSICKDCEFSDSDLSHANFRAADLYRCNFSRAVLYAVELDNANLTRARFTGAYTYGLLVNSSANVTFADILRFEIENKRRSVAFVDGSSDHIVEMSFGETINSTAALCERSYQVGRYRYTFDELDKQEAALQRSQVYNRLKRLYRENQNGEAALHCLYLERYHLTRSYYRYSPMTGGVYREQAFKIVGKTVASFLIELISGYGVRPGRILRNLASLLALFWIVAFVISSTATSPAIAQMSLTCTPAVRSPSGAAEPPICSTRLDPINGGIADSGRLLEFSVISMVNPDPVRFVTSGLLSSIALVYFLCSAILIALLFSSVFVRLLSDS